MRKSIVIGAIFVIILLALGISGCQPEPIKIGFSVQLTGARGELGVMSRNGAQLAVDEINAAGGVNGRPIELLIRDDQGDPEIAWQVDQELIEEGVVAIIGHITSGQTAVVFDQMNAAEVVLLSHSASSSQFSNQDDYFLRTTASTDQLGAVLAEHIFTNQDVRQVAGIIDVQNAAFSESFWDAFSSRFEELGGEVGQIFGFDSGESLDENFVSLLDDDEDYVIVASAVDTALILQYANQQSIKSKFFSSSWAYTEELLYKGGAAVEGLEIVTTYHPENSWPAFEPFVARYEARYNQQPGMLSPKAYDLVRILAQALSHTDGKPQGLREALLSVQDFEGVQGLISFNPYGDVEVDLYIAQVKDGQFEIISTVGK